MPNGETIDYYIHEFSDFVHILAVTDKNEVIMVRQYRHGAGRITLELPGGLADHEGEQNRLLTAQRELLEETGFGGGEWTALPIVYPNPAKLNNKLFSFLATGVKRISEQNLDETEEIEIVLIPIENISQMLFKGEFESVTSMASLIFALNALGLVQVG